MPTAASDVQTAVANALFNAIERGDYPAVENLWAAGVTVWHSGDAADNDRAQAH